MSQDDQSFIKKRPLDLVTSSSDEFSEIDLAVTSKTNLEDLRNEYAERYEKMFGSEADAATKVRNTITPELGEIAQRLVHIAVHSPNERLAADASKYLLDRMVFRATESDDELKNWMKELAGDVKAKGTAGKAINLTGHSKPREALEFKPVDLDDTALD